MTPRQSRVTFTPARHPVFIAEVSGQGPGAPLLQDLLGMLPWSQLPHLASCAAREVGFGNDAAAMTYGDDPDDDEPFEGVRISGEFRDEVADLSRSELDAVLADFFEFALSLGAKAEEPWWPEFVENARRVAARTERPLG